MSITKDEIKKIASLAKLELSAKELKDYSGQLSDVLSYIDQLQKVDTSSVEITTVINEEPDVFGRADKKTAWPKDELALATSQFSEVERGELKVKRILE